MDDLTKLYDPLTLRGVDAVMSVTATGAPGTVRDQLQAIVAHYRPDELILTGMIHDHRARLRSFEIAAEVLQAEAPLPAG